MNAQGAGRLATILMALMLGLWMLSLGACTEEKTVFVEVPQWSDPPAEAAGFLGYDDAGAKLTICGNCHVGEQAEWAGTGHADAWTGLQASGHARESCENCHAVSELGNAATGVDVGWASTGDSRYKDVQCESCHGGGLGHVRNPGASQPIASIAILGEILKAEAVNTCGECHTGSHHGFADEWAQSPHAEPVATVINRANSDPARYGSCLACHSAQGALKAWGVDAPYEEMEAAPADHLGIVCAVCHDPHGGAGNNHQLRFPIDTPDENLNLCMKCHNRRGTPDPGSTHGPHAPEGPLLIGEAGWFPPEFPYAPGEIVPSHGAGGNPEMCATCHVSSWTVNDAETGAFVFNATGHLFLAAPCLDENGVPVPGDCALVDRSFDGCAAGNCHGGNPANARQALDLTWQDLNADADDLQAMLDQVDPAEWDNTNGTSVAEGAEFNVELARLPGTAAHNALLMRALLNSSMDAVTAEYGIPKTAHNRTR